MINLNFSVLERNDSKLITFTDTSTGWGTNSDPNYTSIRSLASNTYALTMDIVINTTSGITTCDTIDLYTIAATTPFAAQSDLVFPIDSTILKVNGNALGTSNFQLYDGIWDVTYKVLHFTGSAWTTLRTFTQSILVYGKSKTAVYDRLRLVPDLHEIGNSYREIQETLFYYTYLQAIEKSAFLAQKSQLLTMLETLERLLLNGSNYPW